MRLRRFAGAACAAIALLTAMPATARADESPYDLTTSTGVIHGTLTLPTGATHPPVVLVIAGSGATDRNGNNIRAGLDNDAYRLIAVALAQQGIATVRFDKRGIGASAAAMSSESNLRFDDYVADVVAWIERLRTDGRFASITIAGHSEGSLIGMIAARQGHADAFVSLDGAGRPASDVIAAQLKPQLAPYPELAAANARILEALVAGQTVADVPPQLAGLYRTSVQPYLISWFRYDPRVEIAKLTIPVTIVQGTSDIQIPVDDAKELAAAKPDAKLVIVDGMSHVLKHAGDMPAAEQVKTVYADPTSPIEPAVPQAIAQTIQSLSASTR